MVSVKLKSMTSLEFAGMNWKPESIAVALSLSHGAAKLDCVTVWFFDSLKAGHE